MKSLTIRDEIHGDMTFDPFLRQVIDHECFQRLRFIKQVGLAEYVFPCATHTRFQHSLGASFLAGRYFNSFVRTWLDSPLSKSILQSGKTTLFHSKTAECVKKVAEDPKSLEFWRQTARLAALLHDVGHGPWSHTFEQLPLRYDLNDAKLNLSGVLKDYFNEPNKKILHEDFSALYVVKILTDLAIRFNKPEWKTFILIVTSLVNGKLVRQFKNELSKEIETNLKESHIRGGIDFHSLIRPIISGPFDVDRIDYIQRDGRNCGVNIGGIEWRRIVSQVAPCLAHHPNDNSEPDSVVLISSVKNLHVLDDFIFSLFQMYTQVYLHPKIVGLEEAIRRVLITKPKLKNFCVTFDTHQHLTDEKFRDWLDSKFDAPEVNGFMLRKPGFEYHAVRDIDLTEDSLEGFTLVSAEDRPMMKDSYGVFFLTSMKTEGAAPRVKPWTAVSPLADYFRTVKYSPKIMVRV